MKLVFVCIACILSFSGVFAQRGHFVFIQNIDKKPFYVRMQEKSYSSSPIGHIVLPLMRDSLYNMFIGYPGGRAEQLFTIKVAGKNRGLDLRAAMITDMLTGVRLNPVASDNKSFSGPRKTDSYSVLMAGVVNDTAVLYNDFMRMDTVSGKVAVVGPVYDKRDIIRWGTENVVGGKLMIYLDRSAPVTDTIRIIVPQL